METSKKYPHSVDTREPMAELKNEANHSSGILQDIKGHCGGKLAPYALLALLTTAGCGKENDQAIVDLQTRVQGIEGQLGTFATKDQVAQVLQDANTYTDTKIAALKTELEAKITGLTTKEQQLRTLIGQIQRGSAGTNSKVAQLNQLMTAVRTDVDDLKSRTTAQDGSLSQIRIHLSNVTARVDQATRTAEQALSRGNEAFALATENKQRLDQSVVKGVFGYKPVVQRDYQHRR